MKKRFFSVLLIVAGAMALGFGEELGVYGKLTVGYQSSKAKIDVDYHVLNYNNGEPYQVKYSVSEAVNTSGLEVMPTLGIVLPFSTEVPFGLFKYAIEASVGFTFGGTDDYYWFKTSSTVINPGVNAILDYHFPTDFPEPLQKLVPYVGAGFSVPIAIVKTEYKSPWKEYDDDSTDACAAFRVNLLTGAHYDIAKKFSVLVEMNFGFSTYFSSSYRAGIRYVFK